jgi:molecular chaperone Hsp33
MDDYIIRASAGNNRIRAFAASSRKTVEKARNIHNTSPVATAALGRLLTAGAMIGLTLKSEKDLITLQIKCDGPLEGLLVTGDSHANVKGYVFEPNVDIPLKKNEKLDVGGAIGNGNLKVIKDIGLKEPYCGMIELVSGEIAEDLTYYFAKSEQVPSSVGLGVLIDTDCSVKQAGGFLIQLMPDCPEETVSELEEKIKNMPSVTKLLEEGMTPEDILKFIIGDFGIEILDKVQMQYKCSCTRERTERALISLGKEELEKIAKEDKKAELTCHFCNTVYKFNEEELLKLLSEAKG